MAIWLTAIKKLIRKVIEGVKDIRDFISPIKEMDVYERRDVVRESYLEAQREYTEGMKRLPREKWAKFDGMVNDLIELRDYDYDSAVEEVKFMLRTDPIDLDDEQIEFLRKHDTP